MKRINRTHWSNLLSRMIALSVLTASVVFGPAVAQAVWTEPTAGTFAPAGNLAAPISSSGIVQTKSGNFTVVGGVSGQTGLTSNAGGVVGTLTGFGGTAVAGSTAAAVRGEPTATSSTGGLQPGVYGLAGRNQNQTAGVYGSNGGFSNAWAARFTGATGADSTVNVFGPLTVAGSGLFGGATYNSYFDPPVASRGPTVSASTGSRAGAVALLGKLSGSLTTGNAIEGSINLTAAGNCTSTVAPCAGVLGMTDSTKFNSLDSANVSFNAGRFSGYFYSSLAVTGTLSDSAGTFPRTYADDRGASFIHPTQFAHLPSGTLLGTFNVGSSDNKQLVVDGEGLWVGGRKKIRRSDGAVLLDTVGPSDGALVYDGTFLWLADSSSNTLYRISTYDGGTSGIMVLPAGRTFPAKQLMYFDGTSIWALTCASNALQLTEFTRYTASGNTNMAIGRTVTVVTPSTCTEKGAVYGMDRFGSRYLFTLVTPNLINRYRYSVGTTPVLENQLQVAPNLFDPTTFFANGGPGFTADGDELILQAVAFVGHVESIFRMNPIDLRPRNSSSILSHLDWLATDGVNLWGVNSAVSPATVSVYRADGSPLTSFGLPAGSNGGQIVFDGTNFWIAGINGDTNVYKVLR